MGIYLPNIKMPIGENDMLQCIISPDGSVQYNLNFETRWHDGIAIELPSHGRLIDADALDFGDIDLCGNDYLYMSEIRKEIANAPTIIPAEGE